MTENTVIEYQSIRKIRGGSTDFSGLAKTCVCLANAQGGKIFIGIEDGKTEPPAGQTVEQSEINKTLDRLRTSAFGVALGKPELHTGENGGQYFSFTVYPTLKTIATTSDGKIYIRIGDKCHPARSEDIMRLASEKSAFQWELERHENVQISDACPDEVRYFVSGIRESRKVKPFVREKTDAEILEHYNLVDGGCLTNLGLLWLDSPGQRSRIAYPLTVQYIVYDDLDRKLRKETWHDNHLNPMKLLEEVEKKAVELTYFHEFPDGLFRKQVRHYAPEVVRELLVNAFAHKIFTISGDIFVEVWPDRMRITSPGGLPLGITRENILHARHRRNPHFMSIFHDLGLMEGEGSGYDLIYEALSRDSKAYPDIESDFNKMAVTLESKIIDAESVKLIDYVAHHFEITQKEFITLGVIARHKKIPSTQLSGILQLSDEDRVRSWVGRLVEKGVVISRGQKKGTAYLMNPKLLSSAHLNVKPTLKTIQLHRLKALIEEDLKYNAASSIRQIHKRLEDVPLQDVRKAVYELRASGVLTSEGAKKNRVYKLAKKNKWKIKWKIKIHKSY